MVHGGLTTARARATLDVARQLAAAVASYRLFPGDLEHEGFAAAVARLRDATDRATAAGPAVFEIRSGVLLVDDLAVPDDGALGRFARDCFDRQVEHVSVLGAPSRAAVAAVADALAEPVDASLASGGPQRVLRERSITSIALDVVVLSREPTDDATLTDEQLRVWRRLSDPESFAAGLIVSGLGEDPASAAAEVHRRLRSVFGVLPDDLIGRGRVLAKMREVVAALPERVGREFLARVMTLAHREHFASTYLTDMTDSELADALLSLAREGGPDARTTAGEVIAATGRSDTVIDLVEVRSPAGDCEREGRGAEPSASVLAGGGDGIGIAVALADALGQEALAAVEGDLRSLREEWPADPDAWAAVGRDTLRDYLVAERDMARLEAALDRWVEQARDAVSRLAVAEVDALLAVLRDAGRLSGDRDRQALLDAASARVVTAELVGSLAASSPDESRTPGPADLLCRFGVGALAAVLDRLAVEPERGARSQLVRVAADLAPGHVERLGERLGDPRWFVVRNLVTILGRMPGAEALPVLVRVLDHPEPAVRREALGALVAVAGGDAVAYIRRLADDPDEHVRVSAVAALTSLRVPLAARALADVAARGRDGEQRHRALEALRDHPAQEASALLEELVDGARGTKLPRGLRRTARAALRARGSR